MIYSYTQLSQYLACPRRYRHRYLQGWVEKDTRAAMLFGRAFENALGAFFRRQDSAEVWFREWSAYREAAALMLGSDESRGYCLEMICADFRTFWPEPI